MKTKDKPQYGTNRAGLIHFIKVVQHDLSKSLAEKNLNFPDVVENYEKYHATAGISGRLDKAKLIEDWIEPGSTFLDVGIGDGLVSEYLMRSRKLKVIGMDISNNACEKARQYGIFTKVRDISNGLGLDISEYYDYVLLMEVIEHTAYPHRILIDAVRHAKKGVIVTIPNSAYIKWRIQLIRGYFPRQSFTHLHFWSIKDFELFCESIGVRMLAFKTFLPRYTLRFRNLLAWQQCWLLAPYSVNGY
jgi:methionine biosynthesis protein MetW